MIVPLNFHVGDPEKTYEYLAHQIEREDNLYQTRLTTCVVVNLGLGAAVASQISADMNIKSYILVLACCVIGYLVTRGVRISMNAGQVQSAYLRKSMGDLIRKTKGQFPYVFYHDPAAKPPGILAKSTAITSVFQMIWAGTFLFVILVFYYSS